MQLCLLVQIVQHHLRYFAALELDDQAHAGLVTLVLNMADALDLLFMDQLGHAFLQRFFVDLVGQLVHDDRLALAFVDVFKVALGAHHHAATARAVAVFDAADAINNAGRWEVRGGDDFHQLVDGGFWVAQHVQTRVHHFVQVVRRNVGGHAHGNAARAIDQQVRYARRQHQRLFFAAVVVGPEINRFLVDVGQHFLGDLGQPDFGVTHGRRVVAVHRAEVTLAVD